MFHLRRLCTSHLNLELINWRLTYRQSALIGQPDRDAPCNVGGLIPTPTTPTIGAREASRASNLMKTESDSWVNYDRVIVDIAPLDRNADDKQAFCRGKALESATVSVSSGYQCLRLAIGMCSVWMCERYDAESKWEWTFLNEKYHLLKTHFHSLDLGFVILLFHVREIKDE